MTGDASFDKLSMRNFSLCHQQFFLILSLSKDARRVCSVFFCSVIPSRAAKRD